MMEGGMSRIYSILSARRLPVLGLFILLLIGAAWIASTISLEEDLNAVIPADSRISDIGEVFDRSELADQLVFMLSHASGKGDPDALIRSADSLVVLLETRDDLIGELSFRTREDAMLGVYDLMYKYLPLFLEEADYKEIEQVLSEENIEATIAADFKLLLSPTGLATGKYLPRDPLNLTPLALRKLQRFQLDDNFTLYNSCIFTRDRQYLMLFLKPAHPSSDTKTNLELIRHIDKSIAYVIEKQPKTGIGYYGGTAVAVANSQRVKKDIRITLSLALTFFLVIFLLFFRRVGTILVLFLPVLVGAVFAIALLTRIYGEVSAIAMGVGVIIIGISVDYSLHLITHIRSGSHPGSAVGKIARPVLMSSMTTASAFLCLTVIRSEAMNQIGIFAATAVVVSACCVLFIIPLLIRKQKDYSWKASSEGQRMQKWLSRPFEKNRRLMLGVLLLSVVLGWSSQHIHFNGDISTLNYMTPELREAEAQLNTISSVANSSIYLVTRGKSLEVALEKLESGSEVLKQAREEGLINEMSSVADLLMTESRQREKIDRWNSFWKEAGKESVVEAVRESGLNNHFTASAFDPFYELLYRDFQPVDLAEFQLLRKLFLDKFIASEDQEVALISVLFAHPENKPALFERFASLKEFIIFDTQYFINQFFEVLKEDFGKLVRISMIVVFLILLLFFGRLELALVTFIPIIVSWMWTLGLMGLFGIQINVFNIIISTFVFGLGIDYCIFIMNGLLADYREGKHSIGPYRLSVLLSAMTTVAAIGVLIFAQHPALKSIAFVSIFGISTVVLISYTLLPLLFHFLVRHGSQDRLYPVTLTWTLASIAVFLVFLVSALVVTLLLPLIAIVPVKKKVKKTWVNVAIYHFSRTIVWMNFFISKKKIDEQHADLSKPSVIIANHQSQLDLVLMLQLRPKVVVLVNKWVWNNPFYGPIIRFADFYPVYRGFDHNFDQLKQKVADGYSILAFPEASRSPDGSIKRFHQGALGIADMLDLEITPVMIHGAHHCLPKGQALLKPGRITMKFFPSIKPEGTIRGGMTTYQPQAKMLTAFYRREYMLLRQKVETPGYYHQRLIARYLYKGPVLEGYLRTKLRLEKSYTFISALIPMEARVADLGCGYGFLAQMLAQVSNKRVVRGLDYDGAKIAVATQAGLHLENLSFGEADLTDHELPDADVYILNDVLHYLDRDQQLALLKKCLYQLPAGGMLLLRDADAKLEKRTRFTRFTEFQSTRLFRFNKTARPLCYLNSELYEEVILKAGCSFERHDLSKRTSNVSYVIRKESGNA